MVQFVLESEQTQNFAASLGILAAIAMNSLGQTKVTFSRQRGKKVEPLKHKPNFSAANIGAFCVRRGRQIFAINNNATRRWRQQAAEQMQHRRLAASRRAHDGHEFALMNFERDAS